jgi:hypothetical protein
MLREAIQKVMEEIEFHEREAKHHLQLADELRNDLRDSFAFLQERRRESPPKEVVDKSQAVVSLEPSPMEQARDERAANKRQRTPAKRKGATRKTK